jgi:hypothetical protein
MCVSPNGCGLNSICSNSAPNQRTCTCQIGWTYAGGNNVVNTYPNGLPAADCSCMTLLHCFSRLSHLIAIINTCTNISSSDINAQCTFSGQLLTRYISMISIATMMLTTRFITCSSGYSIDGSPASATSKYVYGFNNPFTCYCMLVFFCFWVFFFSSSFQLVFII